MTELKGYRVPVANTCHMQEKKPHLDCSTEDWMGWCSAGLVIWQYRVRHGMLNPKKISRTAFAVFMQINLEL